MIFTVFCRQSDNKGTTWIGPAEADSALEAAALGLDDCIDEWNSAGQRYTTDNVSVIGVAEGDVKILLWDDIE